MESRNFILSASAAKYHWKGAGLCSVKSFSGGPAFYNTGSGSFRVDENSFLLLNDGTDYAIEIDQVRPVNSFCLFFDRDLLGEVFYGFQTVEWQLANIGHYPQAIPFFERTYPVASLGNHLAGLRANPELSGDALWLSQTFYRVLGELHALQGQDQAAASRLHAVRPATRAELYRRILKAREFLHGNYERPVGLLETGIAAHLSINHLMRCFRQAFGESPHAYLTRLRIEKACHLLGVSDTSVTDIAEAVGFSSLGSFSLLFKRRTGLSPEAYRHCGPSADRQSF